MAMPVDESFHAMKGYTYPSSKLSHSESEKDAFEVRAERHRTHTALRQVSRQIRRETMEFYFSSNTLVLSAQPDNMPTAIRWLDDADPQAFVYMRKIAFFSERKCGDDPCESYTETSLSLIDLRTFTISAVECEEYCKTCQEAHANQVDYYNDSEGMQELRRAGSTSTILGSDRKELLVEVMQGFSEIPCVSHEPEY